MDTLLTSSKDGLTTQQAQSQLQKFGANDIYQPEKIRFWSIAWEEIREPLILLLIGTGILYSILGSFGDALTIFVVILLLVLSEVFTEFRAKRAINALGEISAPRSLVIRDGKIGEVKTREVVPGDVLILTMGTILAADATAFSAINLEVDESALTGESEPIEKHAGDALYAGTVVVGGEGRAEVTVTGPSTRLGKIAAQTKGIKVPRTPLQLAMRSLAGTLVYVAVFFSVAIPVLGFLRGQNLRTAILTGLALAFAVIPEELPIVITMVLGIGSYNLSRRNLWIKQLRAAESMANTTVIVTDKTGTITEGIMKIVSTYPDNQGEVLWDAALAVSEFALSPLDREIMRAAQAAKPGPLPELVRERSLGDGQKSRATIRRVDDGYILYKSGAPEEVFASCKAVSQAAADDLAQQTQSGRRVIGIACKPLAPEDLQKNFDTLETGMDLVGLIHFEDAPRPGVKETIAQAAAAGIRTIMVTGDHPATASSIAQQVGIHTPKVITGDELGRLPDQDLQRTVREVSVFARTTPEDKYRIVKALQADHEVVAVTGDGINDVLALKGADIGIAMGKRGTDVAKDAADVVLADDNYNTIIMGIFESRGFFDNLLKGLKYYLSIKLALILIFLVPVILYTPFPFSPIQIIVLELFMDLAASAGFVAEPKEKDVFTRKPRNPQEPLFNARTITDIVIKSLFLFAAVTSVFLFSLPRTANTAQAQTYAFSAWIIGHIELAFVSRSDRESILSVGIFTNRVMNVWALAAILFLLVGIYVPYVNSLLRLAPIPPSNLALVAVFVTVIMLLLEVKKLPLFNPQSSPTPG